MKRKNVKQSIFVGKMIGFVKNNFAALFYKMKSASVNKARVN